VRALWTRFVQSSMLLSSLLVVVGVAYVICKKSKRIIYENYEYMCQLYKHKGPAPLIMYN